MRVKVETGDGMRRFLLAGMFLVSVGLLIAAIDLLGILDVANVWSVKWVTGILGTAMLGIAAYIFFLKPTPPPTALEPWHCASCGERELHFTRQCGSCESYRIIRLKTDRLLLREWTDFDLEAFATLNADPRVMEFLPFSVDRAASDTLVSRIRDDFAKHGFGLWAVEVPGVAPFIGFIGLSVPDFKAPFTPCVEIGYRLAFDHWDKGYATEGAKAVLEFGFRQARLKEIVSFTVPENARSLRVMEKVGMTRDPAEDFDYPNLPAGHKLRRHVLYRITPK